MPSFKYVIELSAEDQAKLTDIVTKGKSPVRTILHANILLASGRRNETNMTVSEISKAYHITPTTVRNVRTSYCEKGFETTTNRKKRETPPVPAKVTGEVEAQVVALACGEPPEGYSKWTLRLLADKTVELGYIDSISHVTISTILKKNELKPNLKKCWCIPPKHNAVFVAAMEDVLEVYSRPYDEARPVACMDEKPVQFFADFCTGFRSKRDGVMYEDYQYIRNGTASILLFTEPLAGWRYADAQERRTQQDWARQIEWLLTEQYSTAKKVVLVMDNLNTRSIASLYATFPPQRARQLAERLEIHYTPKHGSWLDIAEIEISAVTVGVHDPAHTCEVGGVESDRGVFALCLLVVHIDPPFWLLLWPSFACGNASILGKWGRSYYQHHQEMPDRCSITDNVNILRQRKKPPTARQSILAGRERLLSALDVVLVRGGAFKSSTPAKIRFLPFLHLSPRNF